VHIQIIKFRLKGVSEADYTKLAAELAPNFAALPGLISKAWIANSDTGTYGGVYFWGDKESMAAYKSSELFNSVATHPNLADVTSEDFAVMEEPSRITRGLLGSG
jgi:hypothetical protein